MYFILSRQNVRQPTQTLQRVEYFRWHHHRQTHVVHRQHRAESKYHAKDDAPYDEQEDQPHKGAGETAHSLHESSYSCFATINKIAHDEASIPRFIVLFTCTAAPVAARGNLFICALRLTGASIELGDRQMAGNLAISMANGAEVYNGRIALPSQVLQF
jgi:hypothetical protein